MIRLLLLAFVLSACARLPSEPTDRPALRDPATAASVAALAGETTRAGVGAPTERWWTSFGLADLDRLIDTALKDHPDMAAAEARLAHARQAERLVRLQAQVNYATDASTSRQRLSRNGLFPPPIGGSSFTQADLSQSLSYDLDWWGRNRALARAAGAETRAAGDEAAAVRLALTAAVADAYFAWGETRDQIALADELTARHRHEYELLKKRFDLGLDAARESIDAKQKLDMDEDRDESLRYLDRSGRYRLASLIGSDPDHAADLPNPSLAARQADLPAAVPLDVLSRRPEVAALRARVEAAAALIRAARAEFYPNIDLRLMLGLETLDLGKLLQAGSITTAFGPAVHLPLFNTASLTTRLNQREADYTAAVAAYNQAVLKAANEVVDRYALLASLEQRALALARATRQAEQLLDLARRRQQIGLAAPLDVLEAEASVLVRRQGENEIQATRLRARVRLFQALGGGAIEPKE